MYRRVAWVCACAFWTWVVLTQVVSADIIFRGDGSAGGLVPDFPQIWAADQKRKSICEAAATADIMWYWDQHGYAGLVDHQNAMNPNATWRQDGQALVYTMAEYIYGMNPSTGRLSPRGQRTTLAALGAYIRAKNQYYNATTKPTGLVVTAYTLDRATATSWDAVLANTEDLMSASVSWRTATGGNYQHPGVGSVIHAMASAGRDTEGKKLVVTHGWQDHPAEQPPYKKPPYAGGENPYIVQYDYQAEQGTDKIKVANAMGVDLFSYNADHVRLDSFYRIGPNPRARMRGDAGAVPGEALVRYSYEIQNASFEPIFQLALEVPVPFSLDDVISPAGWTAMMWDSSLTLDVTPEPVFAPDPGLEQDGSLDGSPILGVLWQSTGSPVLPGESLGGFAFDVSDVFAVGLNNNIAIVSDGLSKGTGLISELHFVPGPVPIPEPASLLLLGAGALLLLCRRRRSTLP